jgi:hypothetical protein
MLVLVPQKGLLRESKWERPSHIHTYQPPKKHPHHNKYGILARPRFNSQAVGYWSTRLASFYLHELCCSETPMDDQDRLVRIQFQPQYLHLTSQGGGANRTNMLRPNAQIELRESKFKPNTNPSLPSQRDTLTTTEDTLTTQSSDGIRSKPQEAK